MTNGDTPTPSAASVPNPEPAAAAQPTAAELSSDESVLSQATPPVLASEREPQELPVSADEPDLAEDLARGTYSSDALAEAWDNVREPPSAVAGHVPRLQALVAELHGRPLLGTSPTTTSDTVDPAAPATSIAAVHASAVTVLERSVATASASDNLPASPEQAAPAAISDEPAVAEPIADSPERTAGVPNAAGTPGPLQGALPAATADDGDDGDDGPLASMSGDAGDRTASALSSSASAVGASQDDLVGEPEDEPAEEPPVPREPHPAQYRNESVALTPDAIVEALLFATDSPLPAARLAELAKLDGSAAIKRCVDRLNERYRALNAAFRVELLAGGYQLLTLPHFAEFVQQLRSSRAESRLSVGAMETLAIVAYKQPVTRAAIEGIRGVSSGEVLRALMERGLVRMVGRAEELGRPMLYGTTKKFLRLFSLPSLRDLPKVEDPTKSTTGGNAKGTPNANGAADVALEAADQSVDSA